VTLLGVIIGAVGALAAAVAAVAAVKALQAARDSASDLARAADASADSVRVAEVSRREADADRLAAAMARQRERLVSLGELVEELYRLTVGQLERGPGVQPWMSVRNRIRQAVIGLSSELPECSSIEGASWESWAHGAASRARAEIGTALEKLDREAASPPPGSGTRADAPV
jgi:hypothetical protein